MSEVVANRWKNLDGTENFKCRAFVNFNGLGSVAVRAAGNVSNIIDNGTGNYTVNFTTPMSDANYTVGGMSSGGSGGFPAGGVLVLSEAISSASTYTLKTTSAVQVVTCDNNGDVFYDAFSVNVTIHR